MDSGMRMTGLASGMDIDSMVTQMMNAERIKVDRMEQDKTWVEWQREDLRSMNSQFQSFRPSSTDAIFSKSTFTGSVATSDNEDVATASASSDANEGTYTISNISQLATAASKGSTGDIADDLASDAELHNIRDFDIAENTDFTFEISTADGSKEFTMNSSDSMQDVVDKVNNSELGLNAFYDEETRQFSMMRSETGELRNDGSDEISIETDNAGFIGSLNLGAEDVQNAQFELNGMAMEKASNSFEVNGLDINLKSTSANPVNIEVGQDKATAKEAIMNFVDDYNELIADANEKTMETRNRDYEPLTDTQKDEMSEKEIEQWEEMARSGTLRNERSVSNALTQMRQDFSENVDSTNQDSDMTDMTDIGLETGDWRTQGLIEVDEAKLDKALEKDADAVYEMFNADGGTHAEQGIARRLRDTVGDAVDSMSRRAGNENSITDQSHTMGKEIERISDRIESFEERLADKEQRYYAEFTRMETAIQRNNSQMQQMQSAMGGMGGGMMG
ncbi:flagellar hook-associated protein 2 [Salibacterium salarium]|uniref:flagellar filament capping protein FliD n=1 Tax=Salibacterium salarium TaxID=284579 RepID=UPI0027881806|nr:flagellar filament capping protein FliD [Salibacterium salarium]MDQ0298239.1 flagellar hook-associated protein 2 [Salibacterium salarium]